MQGSLERAVGIQPSCSSRSKRHLCSRSWDQEWTWIWTNTSASFPQRPAGKSKEFLHRFLCFSLHNPEFYNLAGKLGEIPKFCLVSCQHHVKAEIQKNFDINPWICGVHRKELFNLQPLRLQRSQAALFRAFKHAVFSTERLTPNYTTLFFKKKRNYLWVDLSTSIFQWLELGATMQGLSSKLRSQILQTTDIQRALRRAVPEIRYISLDKGLNVVIQGVTVCSGALCNCTSPNQHMGSYLNQAASLRSESVLGKIMWELWRNDTYFKLEESCWNFFQWILRKIHFSQVIFPEHSQCIR